LGSWAPDLSSHNTGLGVLWRWTGQGVPFNSMVGGPLRWCPEKSEHYLRNVMTTRMGLMVDTDFQSFIDRVKAANAIEDVIEASGPEFKLQRKHGNYLRGETHDSLVVRVDEQYYVWNERSEKGDIFNWLEYRNKWDFWESLQWLADRAKMDMPARFQQQGNQTARASGRLRADAWGIAQRVMAKWLWEDPEALEYVRGRGWTDETIQEAGLGFSGRLKPEQLKELQGEFSMHEIDLASPAAVAILGWRGDVKAWGRKWNIDVQSNWIGWKMIPGLVGRTRLIYPHWVGGRVKYFSARNILGAEINKEGRTVKSYNLPVALAGPRKAFYNHAYGRRAEQCVCVEGPADAITLGQWGIPAMAIVGTSWNDHEETLIELRKRHDTLYLGLDSDEAGQTALMGRDQRWPLGHIVGAMARVVTWPGEKDANDWLQAMIEEGIEPEDQAKGAQGVLTAAATVVERAAMWAGGLRGAKRDEAFKIAFSLIARMDRVSRAQYRSNLAELLGLGVRDFDNILKELLKGSGGDEKELPTIETLGGQVHGWLLDYVYDPENDQAKLVYRDPERKVGISEEVEIENVKYKAKPPNAFVRGGGVLFASELGQLKSTRELVAIVEAFVNKYYLIG